MPEGHEYPPKPVSINVEEPRKGFSELTPPQKVLAILAAVEEPISQEYVYQLAGIELNKLNNDKKVVVGAVFNDSRIQHSKNEELHVEQFRIDPKKQGEVFQEIGIESGIAHFQIADSIIKRLRGQ